MSKQTADLNQYGDHLENVFYADLEADWEAVSEYDAHIPDVFLRQAILSHRVAVYKFLGSESGEQYVTGVLRFGFFWDKVPFLNLLYVPEGNTHRGYGSALLLFWENEMRRSGFTRVYASTMAKERGQHFFRQYGYVDVGNLYVEGEGLELILEKRL